MHLTVERAVARLNEITPFHARQAALPEPVRAVHRAVLAGFFTRGQAPSRADLANRFAGTDVDAALARLREDDLVVLDDAGEPVGAYPVTAEDTPHVVRLGGHRINAMCALDALAVSPMAGQPAVIESRCHVTGEPVRVEQDGRRIIDACPRAGLHFGMRWQPPRICAAHSLCREMVFLHDAGVAKEWEMEADMQRSIFPLDRAVDFAAGFFMPLVG